MLFRGCVVNRLFFLLQAEDGIRDLVRSRGLGDVYKRQQDVQSFNWLFLLMWAFGVLFTFVYIAYNDMVVGKYQWPLWLNYLVNIIATFYLVWAKYYYGRLKKS